MADNAANDSDTSTPVSGRQVTLKTYVDMNSDFPGRGPSTTFSSTAAATGQCACFDISAGFKKGDNALLDSGLVVCVKLICSTGCSFVNARIGISDTKFYVGGSIGKSHDFLDVSLTLSEETIATTRCFTGCWLFLLPQFKYSDAVLIALGQKSNLIPIVVTFKVSATDAGQELKLGKILTSSVSNPESPISLNPAAEPVLGYVLMKESPICLFGGDSLEFKQDPLTDFALVAQDASLHCHRSILAMKSPVIKRMLLDDVKETNEGHLQLRDSANELVDLQVAKAFLKCIYYEAYSIDLEESQHLASLLRLFHMYEMQSCLVRCADAMAKKVAQDPDASPTFFMLATQFGLKILATACIEVM